SNENSSAWASYAALTAGCFSIFRTSSLCVIILLNLFQSFTRDLQLLCRCLGRLLHKRVEHDDSPIGPGAEEHPANPFLGLQTQFKQALAHRSRVRHSQVWAERQHALGEMDVSRL